MNFAINLLHSLQNFEAQVFLMITEYDSLVDDLKPLIICYTKWQLTSFLKC